MFYILYMSHTIRHKTNYKTRTSKYRSNRYSGYDHFKLSPYGIHDYDYSFQRWCNKRGEWYLGEDVISLINKKGYRQNLKRELKNIIDEECLEY